MSYTAQIQALYVAYFNRPADVAGLDYWNSVLTANGGNTAPVSSAFSTSSEYTAKYAGMTPYQVVNQVYQNLFGHSADPAGLVYWGNLLANNTLHIADIVTDVAAGAQGTDLTAYNNQVTAAGDFTAALVTTAQIVGYSAAAGSAAGAAANAAASAFLQTVVANPTGATGTALTTVLNNNLAAAVTPAALNTTIAMVDNAGTLGTNFTLTTSADTATANQFNGSTLDSFNAFDNLTGQANFTNNTLNALISGGSGTAGTLPGGITVSNIQNANINVEQGSGSAQASFTANVSGWTGLTNLVLKDAVAAAPDAITITAATTTAVAVTNSSAGTTAVHGAGGAVSVMSNGGTVGVGGAAAGTGVSDTTANALTSVSVTGAAATGVNDNSGSAAATGSTGGGLKRN